MEPCPRTPTCPLFKATAIRTTLAVWRTFYCETNYPRCARWKLASAGAEVALNLLPNGTTLAVPLAQLDPDLPGRCK